MIHHKVGCQGTLRHREDKDQDYFKCTKCGTAWSKRKRKSKKK